MERRCHFKLCTFVLLFITDIIQGFTIILHDLSFCTQCSATECGKTGQQTRRVLCSLPNGQALPPSNCNDRAKPQEIHVCTASCTRAETEAAQRPKEPDWWTGPWSTVSNRSQPSHTQTAISNSNSNYNSNRNNNFSHNNKQQYIPHQTPPRSNHPHRSHYPPSHSTRTIASTTPSSSPTSSNRLHYGLPYHLRNGRRRTSSNNLHRYNPAVDDSLNRLTARSRRRFSPEGNAFNSGIRNNYRYDRSRPDSNSLRRRNNNFHRRSSTSLYRRRNYRLDARNRYRGRRKYRSRQTANNFRHSNTYNGHRHEHRSSPTSYKRNFEESRRLARQDSRHRQAFQRSGRETRSRTVQPQQSNIRPKRTYQSRGTTTLPSDNKRSSNRHESYKSAAHVSEVAKKAQPRASDEIKPRTATGESFRAAWDRYRSRRHRYGGYRRNYSQHSRPVRPGSNRRSSAAVLRQEVENRRSIPTLASSADQRSYHYSQTSVRNENTTRTSAFEEDIDGRRNKRLEGLARKPTELLQTRPNPARKIGQENRSPTLWRRTTSYPYKSRRMSSRTPEPTTQIRRYRYLNQNPQTSMTAEDTATARSEIALEKTLKQAVVSESGNKSPLSQLTLEERQELMHSDAVRRRRQRRRNGKG